MVGQVSVQNLSLVISMLYQVAEEVKSNLLTPDPRSLVMVMVTMIHGWGMSKGIGSNKSWLSTSKTWYIRSTCRMSLSHSRISTKRSKWNLRRKKSRGEFLQRSRWSSRSSISKSFRTLTRMCCRTRWHTCRCKSRCRWWRSRELRKYRLNDAKHRETKRNSSEGKSSCSRMSTEMFLMVRR